MRAKVSSHDLPPRLEMECLKALWCLGRGSVRDVQEHITPSRQLAYTTVMTVMDRLARRGCVQRVRSGRSFVYTPVVSRDDVQQLAVQDLVESLFDGSRDSLRQFLG
jgi:predicted transcriptional regulator